MKQKSIIFLFQIYLYTHILLDWHIQQVSYLFNKAQFIYRNDLFLDLIFTKMSITLLSALCLLFLIDREAKLLHLNF